MQTTIVPKIFFVGGGGIPKKPILFLSVTMLCHPCLAKFQFIVQSLWAGIRFWALRHCWLADDVAILQLQMVF